MLFPTPALAAGTTITVTGTADNALLANLSGNGTCDLREAILAANNNINSGECPAGSGTDSDTIAFNIPGGGIKQITTVAMLSLGGDVVLDGTTQPGYAGSPLIRLDGANAVPNGLFIVGTGEATIKGLMLTRFTSKSLLINQDHVIVRRNYIGTDGVSDLTTAAAGIAITAQYVQVGGANASQRNVIAGSTYGIELYGNADHNTIQGNYLGIRADGSAAMPTPGTAGVALSDSGGQGASFNLVKGNVISGYTYGIRSFSATDDQNTFQDNLIGTDATGTVALGNTTGIHLNAGDDNLVTGNLISGNSYGIRVTGAAGTTISNNKIGTDLSGMSALPNSSYGIWLDGAPAAIGDGTTAGDNLISGNTVAGIYLTGAGTSGTTILGNKIGPSLDGSDILPNGNSPTKGGILISDNASARVAGNWIAGNSMNGIFVGLTGTVDAGSADNCFTGNELFGAYNNSGVELPLANNWWGDARGPYHPVNYPTGLGDPVFDDVDASPFLTFPPAACAILTGPTSFNFGEQLLKTSDQTTIELTNTGASAISFTNIFTAAPFSLLDTSTCPLAGGDLNAGASCTLDLEFSPTTEGLAAGGLTLMHDLGGSAYIISLKGTGVKGTQLLNNTSFENDADADNKPDGWTYTQFAPATDQQDCAIAKAGSCSLKLVGNNQLKVVKKTILQSGAAGDDFTFFLWSKASAVPAAAVYRVQVQFYNGATLVATRTKNFSTGTHAFEKVSGKFTATVPYTKVVFKISIDASSGTAWFDKASLRWAP